MCASLPLAQTAALLTFDLCQRSSTDNQSCSHSPLSPTEPAAETFYPGPNTIAKRGAEMNAERHCCEWLAACLRTRAGPNRPMSLRPHSHSVQPGRADP